MSFPLTARYSLSCFAEKAIEEVTSQQQCARHPPTNTFGGRLVLPSGLLACLSIAHTGESATTEVTLLFLAEQPADRNGYPWSPASTTVFLMHH